MQRQFPLLYWGALCALTTGIFSFSDCALAFTPRSVAYTSSQIVRFGLENSDSGVDVSDLGLTMDDLNAPLPSEFFQDFQSSGYESTSRIPSVEDNACQWTESPSEISATLTIPGLRGQPAMALAVLTSTTTISVSAFGRVVWSCILRGEVDADSASFETEDGADMVPIIKYSVTKKESSGRWDGFILQVGEDSIL